MHMEALNRLQYFCPIVLWSKKHCRKNKSLSQFVYLIKNKKKKKGKAATGLQIKP